MCASYNNDTLKRLVADFEPFDDQESADRTTMLQFIDTFDDTVTRDNIFGHFTASAFVVNESRTRTVLLKHNIFGDFVYPGGHADGEYDLLSVALREVEEETGLIAEPLNNGEIFCLQCIPVKGHVKNGKYVSPHVHYDAAFLVIVKDSDMDKIRILESENSAVEWVPIYDTWLDGMADWFQYVYVKFKKKFGGASYEED
jgi:8-oxo-dGTP pyrophosphatase MutT (NUDIX family)